MSRINKKGISPVIATVIIVSVAIAIAVAVAFWMTGITGLFTRYERVEITNCYADWKGDYNAWLIVIQPGPGIMITIVISSPAFRGTPLVKSNLVK